MFEFENNSLTIVKKRKNDEYDLELGLAMSNSIKKVAGLQILSPEEIHARIQEKVKSYILGGEIKR